MTNGVEADPKETRRKVEKAWQMAKEKGMAGIRRGLDSVGLYGHGRRFHPVGRLETLSAGERVCPLA